MKIAGAIGDKLPFLNRILRDIDSRDFFRKGISFLLFVGAFFVLALAVGGLAYGAIDVFGTERFGVFSKITGLIAAPLGMAGGFYAFGLIGKRAKEMAARGPMGMIDLTIAFLRVFAEALAVMLVAFGVAQAFTQLLAGAEGRSVAAFIFVRGPMELLEKFLEADGALLIRIGAVLALAFSLVFAFAVLYGSYLATEIGDLLHRFLRRDGGASRSSAVTGQGPSTQDFVTPEPTRPDREGPRRTNPVARIPVAPAATPAAPEPVPAAAPAIPAVEPTAKQPSPEMKPYPGYPGYFMCPSCSGAVTANDAACGHCDAQLL